MCGRRHAHDESLAMKTLDLPQREPSPTVAPEPVRIPLPHATRAQRFGLLAGLAVVLAAALHLFASILLPFVAAAGIAYFLDPPTTRLTRAVAGRPGEREPMIDSTGRAMMATRASAAMTMTTAERPAGRGRWG